MDTTFNELDDFLKHHGILGMRWGVRRYQYPDGSLTPAGRKRYEKEIGAQEGNAANKNASQPYNTAQQPVRMGPRPASELTDQELRDYLNRADLERRYNALFDTDQREEVRVVKKPASEMTSKEMQDYIARIDLEKKYNAVINPPKPPSMGERFIRAAGDVLATSAKKAATTYVTTTLTDLLTRKKSDKDDNGNSDNKNNKNDKKVDELSNTLTSFIKEYRNSNNNKKNDKSDRSLKDNKPKGLLEAPKSEKKKDKKNKSDPDEYENDDIVVEFDYHHVLTPKEAQREAKAFYREQKKEEKRRKAEAEAQRRQREHEAWYERNAQWQESQYIANHVKDNVDSFSNPVWDSAGSDFVYGPIWDSTPAYEAYDW